MTATITSPPAAATQTRVSNLAPGLVLVAAITGLSFLIGHLAAWQSRDGVHHQPLEPVVVAVIMGLLIGNLVSLAPSVRPGLEFSARRLLAYGVVLLGARLDFFSLLRVGAVGLSASVAVVISCAIFFYLFGSAFKLSREQSLLLAAGTAICGGTAIMAIAPIIRAKSHDVVIGVATVTLLGLFCMLGLPWIAQALGMGQWQFGIWAGLTIHQTPQAIAAGLSYGSEAAEIATVIKLSRVCMLAPFALVLALSLPSDNQPVNWRRILKFVPSFVVGFLLMALARTFGLLPDISVNWPRFPAGEATASFGLQPLFVTISSCLLAMSMAAVGLETQLSTFKADSLRPFAAAATCSGLLVLAVGISLVIF